ncbi:MAG: hypothetical protein WCX74_01325 [Candidatus Paceibacterota bacterium]
MSSDITENIEEKERGNSPSFGLSAKNEKEAAEAIALQIGKIEETLNSIRKMEQEEKGEKPAFESDEKEQGEISNIPKAEVVDFGGKKKLKESLENWTPETIKQEPVLFIEDILKDIQTQEKTGREAVIPEDALRAVLQLLEEELDFSIESDGKIFELAKSAFNSENVSLIVQELYNIKDFFRVNGIVKNYLNSEGEKDKEVHEGGQFEVARGGIETVQKAGIGSVSQMGNIFQREHTIEELVKKKVNPADGEEGIKESNILVSQNVPSREVFPKENTIKTNESEKGMEKEGKEKRYIEIVKDLVRMKLKMKEIGREVKKKEGVLRRLRIDDGKDTMLDSEYMNIEKEYRELMKTLLAEGADGEEIEEKVGSMCNELEKRNARFTHEKAEEYIQHLKKIVEYQKELLPKGKRELYKKLVAFIENEKARIMIGAMILGIPMAVPKNGKVKWLTEGDKSLLAELGVPLKSTSGAYLESVYKKILEVRETAHERIEKIVEGDDKIRASGPVFRQAQTVGFFNDYSVKPKNNFLETKKQILES